MNNSARWLAVLALLIARGVNGQGAGPEHVVRVRLVVTSTLAHANTPLDPLIDFAELVRQSGHPGVLDPNSIEVLDARTGHVVPRALSEDFAYGDRGRVEFVAADPRHVEYEIRFRVGPRRPPLAAEPYVPAIGVGDLLRYNASQARPIVVSYSAGLHDLDGDGLLDLTGTWNYAYRPGWPWDGVVMFPRVANGGKFEFGNLVRARFAPDREAAPQFLSHTYMAVDFADFNRDGQLDVVLTKNGKNTAEFHLNRGRREPTGMPIFEPAGEVRVAGWEAPHAVDLDQDGALDLVIDGHFVRNTNPQGWPFTAAESAKLDAGRQPCFLDLDADGRLDSVCLQGGATLQPDFYRLAYRRNLGGRLPRFDAEQLLNEIDLLSISQVSTWRTGEQSGLIVQHNAFQELAFFQLHSPLAGANETARRTFQPVGRAVSHSAVMSLSDQAWPCLCDWDDDGDLDLLVGGGYGWPRIVINDGTRQRPAFREPQFILSAGRPIRLVRNELLGPPSSWHDMGYSYPVFVDWDGDGRRDLVCPNETNRIYWFRNIGSPREPTFGPRQTIECDGFPDDDDHRRQSATRANDPTSSEGVYPAEAERPFFWRTGAALADFNGDGRLDLVTLDGHTRSATLFVQDRTDGTEPRLRKDRTLKLVDGRAINDTIVERKAHWTESFRAIDWNGDGLQDLVYSVAGAYGGTLDQGSIYLLLNAGTRTDPVFAAPQAMRCFGEPIRITSHGPHPWVGDFDGDGSPDLVACVEWSVYPYYAHAALRMDRRPDFTVQLATMRP